jgi:hypothetical protein
VCNAPGRALNWLNFTSYAWGDDRDKPEDFIGWLPVSVTANVEAALQEQNSHTLFLFEIWIDTICIGQGSIQHR